MTRVLPAVSRGVAKKSGLNSKVSIQRIFACWEDIIGKDFAGKCVPINLSWRKNNVSSKIKKKQPFLGTLKAMPIAKAIDPNAHAPSEAEKGAQNTKKTKEKAHLNTVATLHIISSSAIATRIMYQEHLILERIQRVLGYDAITSISIKHESGLNKTGFMPPLPKKLTSTEKSDLSTMVGEIQDNALRERLESLGKKIILSKQ